jgi:hypothetical protein
VYITRSLQWIRTKVRDTPKFERSTNVSSFVNQFKLQIHEHQRLLALDVALRETPVRWWETHKEGIEEWKHCKRLM